MKRSIHLLEPYRSALIALAFDEGLVHAVPEGVEKNSQMLQIGRNKKLQKTLLQLSILFDEMTIVWSEPSEELRKKGPFLTAKGLENTEIVSFIQETGQAARSWPNDKNDVKDIWKIEKRDIDDFLPLILSQLDARGKAINYNLFRLLKAYRLEEIEFVDDIETKIPIKLLAEAEAIKNNLPYVFNSFDAPILATLNEVRYSLNYIDKTNAKLASAEFGEKRERLKNAKLLPEASEMLYAITIDELLKENLTLPMPDNIISAVKLRDKREISDFRGVFFPWINNLCSGNEKEEKKLRKEIKKAVYQFQTYPKLEQIASIISYTTLSFAAIEALQGIITPSLPLSIVAVGCQGLAKRWKNKSSWVCLAEKATSF